MIEGQDLVRLTCLSFAIVFEKWIQMLYLLLVENLWWTNLSMAHLVLILTIWFIKIYALTTAESHLFVFVSAYRILFQTQVLSL